MSIEPPFYKKGLTPSHFLSIVGASLIRNQHGKDELNVGFAPPRPLRPCRFVPFYNHKILFKILFIIRLKSSQSILLKRSFFHCIPYVPGSFGRSGPIQQNSCATECRSRKYQITIHQIIVIKLIFHISIQVVSEKIYNINPRAKNTNLI